MKILMLNTFDDLGGAAKAASRLHKGLRSLGVETDLLVQFKYGKENEAICDDTPLTKMVRRLKGYMGMLPVRMYPNRPENNFSPALLPDSLPATIAPLQPDLLHLHWLGAGFCQVETLARFKKPLVWTLHDSWAFTGGCHVPFACKKYQQQCGACPVLGSSRERDLSRWIWQRKNKSWRNLNLTVVTPSHWLAGCAGVSALFRNARIEVIPNGLDLNLFKPTDKQLARRLLSLPQDKKLILFGAMDSTSDPNKGFHLLLPAITRLASSGFGDTAELLIFGADRPASPPSFGMKAHYLGQINDDSRLVLLYAAADLFVSPSILENLPNTIMEAMSCKIPCIAFAQGGVEDLISHGQTGFLAEAYQSDDLAVWISRLLANDETRLAMAHRARQMMETKFSIEHVTRRYIALYREIAMRSRRRQ